MLGLILLPGGIFWKKIDYDCAWDYSTYYTLAEAVMHCRNLGTKCTGIALSDGCSESKSSEFFNVCIGSLSRFPNKRFCMYTPMNLTGLLCCEWLWIINWLCAANIYIYFMNTTHTKKYI